MPPNTKRGLRRTRKRPLRGLHEQKYRMATSTASGLPYVLLSQLSPTVIKDIRLRIGLDAQPLAFVKFRVPRRRRFVSGDAKRPEGLAMEALRRPTKSRQGAKPTAPCRHTAALRAAGFVVARSANRDKDVERWRQLAHCSTTALGYAAKLTSSPSLLPVRRR